MPNINCINTDRSCTVCTFEIERINYSINMDYTEDKNLFLREGEAVNLFRAVP